MRAFIGEALRRDEDKRVRDRIEQEECARVAEALAKARGRVAWAAGIGLIVSLGLATVAGWQWRRAETTLALATNAANAMVIDLAKSMRDRAGMPIDLVRDILSPRSKTPDEARRIEPGPPRSVAQRSGGNSMKSC